MVDKRNSDRRKSRDVRMREKLEKILEACRYERDDFNHRVPSIKAIAIEIEALYRPAQQNPEVVKRLEEFRQRLDTPC